MTIYSPAGVAYSSKAESQTILDHLRKRFTEDALSLPGAVAEKLGNATFESSRDLPYFPIPFKETEVSAALKAIEGIVAACLSDLRAPSDGSRAVTVNLEKTTAFLFQTYLATVGGYGKLAPEAKRFLKGN